jgi:hypothetical protein
MLKTIVASTRECDDVDDAVTEILAQLQLDKPDTLLRNTIGIISSYWDFVPAGIFQAVCDSLPFEVVGGTCCIQSVNGEDDDLMFSVTVLTSDTITFRPVLTSSVSENAEKAVADACAAATADGATPSLALMYAPHLVNKNCGDTYVRAFNRASGGGIVSPVPLFGTLCLEEADEMEHRRPVVLYNGAFYQEQAVLLFFYGEVNVRFYIGTIAGADENTPEQSPAKPTLISSDMKVTASEENRLFAVNGRPVADFLDDLGMLETAQKSFSMASFPFFVNRNDGTPPSLNYFVQYLPEEGYALCGGDIPVGSTLSMYLNDSNSILETARSAVQRAIAENPNAALFLAYPCSSREWILGAADCAGAEKALFNELLAEVPANRILAYSSGEICPVGKVGNDYANRFQGITFTLAVLSNEP